MSPKQKAEELVDKFIKTNGNAFFAKQCALIAVDELIEETDYYFWKEVKKEIEKL